MQTSPATSEAALAHRASPHLWRGIVLLLVCASFWSLNGPLIKLLNREHVPGISIACLRSLLGGLVLLPFAWRNRATLSHVRARWPLGTMLLFTMMTATFVIANTVTFAANAIILQYTSPVWVFLLAYLILHERPRRADLFAVALAFVGIVLLYRGNPPGNVLGLTLALVSGFGFGALTVTLRRMREVHPLVITTMNTLGSGLLLLVPTLIWGRFEVTGWVVFLIVFTAVVQFTLPYVLFAWGLRYVPASRAALILLLEAILNPVWTFLALGERPPDATLLGGPLVLAAALLSLWPGKRAAS